MTKIIFRDHSAGSRDTVEVSLPRAVVIERLRTMIGRPIFELSIWEESFTYARVDGEVIVLHFFGFGNDAIAATQNEILGALTRRVVT